MLLDLNLQKSFAISRQRVFINRRFPCPTKRDGNPYAGARCTDCRPRWCLRLSCAFHWLHLLGHATAWQFFQRCRTPTLNKGDNIKLVDACFSLSSLYTSEIYSQSTCQTCNHHGRYSPESGNVSGRSMITAWIAISIPHR